MAAITMIKNGVMDNLHGLLETSTRVTMRQIKEMGMDKFTGLMELAIKANGLMEFSMASVTNH